MDVRIIAATNRNLLEEVKRGQFREDLYYRLNVIPIHLPPLAKRRNDIPLLARHFLRRFALTHGKTMESLSPEAMSVLLDHSWPGNVRELENTIEHAVVLAKGPRIEVSHFPGSIRAAGSSPTHADRHLPLCITKESCCGKPWKRAAGTKRRPRTVWASAAARCMKNSGNTRSSHPQNTSMGGADERQQIPQELSV